MGRTEISRNQFSCIYTASVTVSAIVTVRVFMLKEEEKGGGGWWVVEAG